MCLIFKFNVPTYYQLLDKNKNKILYLPKESIFITFRSRVYLKTLNFYFVFSMFVKFIVISNISVRYKNNYLNLPQVFRTNFCLKGIFARLRNVGKIFFIFKREFGVLSEQLSFRSSYLSILNILFNIIND